MSFQPDFCPRSDCPSNSGQLFRFHRRGIYTRRCDRRIVRRFRCLVCRHDFSTQTLRLDYRLKRPGLLPRLFRDRVSKVTHRQSARNLGCSRSTEERHFRRLSAHCQAFHGKCLAKVAASGGLGELFLLDELETYEHHRLKQPVTVPVLIERYSGFMLDARSGAMAPRGKRGRPRPPDSGRKSESRRVVRRSLRLLRAFSPKDRQLTLRTDQKSSYSTITRELFGERCLHRQTSSRLRRDVSNPLWPVNHTLARLRDGLSRLVRRNWAAAKRRPNLDGHLAIFICYRNYVRGRTNREPRLPPAVVLGVLEQQWSIERLLLRRLFKWR